MIKMLCFSFLFFLACTNKKEIAYTEYNITNFNKRDCYDVRVMDYRLPEKTDFKNRGYASIYICYDVRQKRNVKIISNCQNFPFKTNTLVILSDCVKLSPNKNLMVVSDSIFEREYRGLPTFYANLHILVM